jgi:lysophospholipase L1-like esterase
MRRKLLLLLLWLAVPLAAGELYLRAAVGPPVHFRHPQESYVADPEIGVRLAPNQHSYTHAKSVATDRYGFRGPDYETAPPPGVARIVALGDSQTFGNGVAFEETWGEQTRALLAARQPPIAVEVVNAGVPGTDTWQHVAIARRALQTYRGISHVVLAVYVNDVAARYAPPPLEARSTTPARRALHALKRSALFSAVWASYQGAIAAPGRGAHEEEQMRGSADPRIDPGWAEVDRSLAQIAELAAAERARLLVVVLPRRDQVRAPSAPRGYNDRMAAICDRLGIAHIDVLDALRRAYASEGEALFIPWDGHNARAANAAIAREVAAWLAPELAVRSD